LALAEFDGDLKLMLTSLSPDSKFKVLGMAQGQMDGLANLRDALKTKIKDIINSDFDKTLY